MDAVDLIAEAIENVSYRPPETWRVAPDYSTRERLLIGAMEAFYGAGAADEQAGTTDGVGHVFRVDRFTLETDSQGFVRFTEHETQAKAETLVAEYERDEDGDDA